MLLVLSLILPHKTNLPSHPRYQKVFFLFLLCILLQLYPWFSPFSKCSAHLSLVLSLWLIVALFVSQTGISPDCLLPFSLLLCQYNILLLCYLATFSRSLAILSMISPSHLLSSYFMISPLCLYFFYFHDLWLR